MVKDKIFITGERNYKDESKVIDLLNKIKESYEKQTDFVLIRLDTLKGVDGIIRVWALENNIQILTVSVLWKLFGYDAKIRANEFIIKELKPSYLITFGYDSNLAVCQMCAKNNNIPVFNY